VSGSFPGDADCDYLIIEDANKGLEFIQVSYDRDRPADNQLETWVQGSYLFSLLRWNCRMRMLPNDYIVTETSNLPHSCQRVKI